MTVLEGKNIKEYYFFAVWKKKRIFAVCNNSNNKINNKQ